jgi:hypothetical protein
VSLAELFSEIFAPEATFWRLRPDRKNETVFFGKIGPDFCGGKAAD